MSGFRCDTYQNEYLPVGGVDVDAIVTVGSSAETSDPRATDGAPVRHVVVVVIDVSTSMTWGKLRAAKKAAIAAVEALRDRTQFAIIAGSDQATQVYPAVGTVGASAETRREAGAAIRLASAGGGTTMSRWLDAAAQVFAPHSGAVRQAILLTDGKNEGEHHADLEAALDRCAGSFQCDCRGIGTEWSVAELRLIADRLLGSVEVLATPSDMERDFRTIVERTLRRHTAEVRLRLATAPGVEIRSLRQVAPTIVDLLAHADRPDDRVIEVDTGSWGAEERDYHVALRVPPQTPGDVMLAGRVAIVVDGQPVAAGQIRAVWTEDEATATVIEPHVAHYTGQVHLAQSIADGLAARERGDDALAAEHLSRAVELARTSGHEATSQLLARVVEVDHTGTVSVRRSVDALDEMALDTRSTTTIRLTG